MGAGQVAYMANTGPRSNGNLALWRLRALANVLLRTPPSITEPGHIYTTVCEIYMPGREETGNEIQLNSAKIAPIREYPGYPD